MSRYTRTEKRQLSRLHGLAMRQRAARRAAFVVGVVASLLSFLSGACAAAVMR